MDVQKIVLAYSGGLDTSCIVQWLVENYGCEVICFCANLGQEEELSGLEAKALASGASKLYVEDLRDIPAGVIGGAIDLNYDASAVVPTGEVVYGDAFSMFQQGEVNGDEGLVDDEVMAIDSGRKACRHEFHRVCTGDLAFAYQHCHLSAQEIIEHNFNHSPLIQMEVQSGGFIKGIGEILRQGIGFRKCVSRNGGHSVILPGFFQGRFQCTNVRVTFCRIRTNVSGKITFRTATSNAAAKIIRNSSGADAGTIIGEMKQGVGKLGIVIREIGPLLFQLAPG